MSEYFKTALVLGAGGFIGSHMVKRLRSEGYWVRGVDLKYPEFSVSEAHEFIIGDLRDVGFVERCIRYAGPYNNHLMKSISLLLIWVEQDLSLLVRMMLILCTILLRLT